jgi:hypothetical protein
MINFFYPSVLTVSVSEGNDQSATPAAPVADGAVPKVKTEKECK